MVGEPQVHFMLGPTFSEQSEWLARYFDVGQEDPPRKVRPGFLPVVSVHRDTRKLTFMSPCVLPRS